MSRRPSPAPVVIAAACALALLLVAGERPARAAPPVPPEPVSIPPSFTARERDAAERVTARAISAHVRYLADDLLEGRAPGTRGSDLAMKYVAAEYERLGLAPAGDEAPGGGPRGYLQRFDAVRLASELTAPPTFRGARGATLALRPVEEMVVAPGRQQDAIALRDGELVFVGYGITAPEQRWDDFKGVDVRGKVLLVMNNDPESDPSLFAGKTRLYYGRWSYKYEEAGRRGAAGVIIIHTTPSAGYPWQVVQTSWSGPQVELPARAGEPRVDVKMWATEDAARRVVALGGQDLDALRRRAEQRDFRPVPLGVRLTTSLRTRLERFQTANVLGMLPGRDAQLGRELVVYTAHHDHLGSHPGPKPGADTIYNGALDNASGVAAMLAIAEGMLEARPAPRRSVLFAAVGGEESGLLGSEYLCQHPPVPPGRIAVDINIDGIDIWGRTRDVTYIGLGRSPALDDVVRRTAREQHRQVEPDQFPDRGSFYRSDQFSFARIGVPAIYVHTGTSFIGREPGWGRERIEEFTRVRYHQVTDQIDASWNLDGAVDDARLLLAVGMRLADAPAMPTWIPGDEFEAARKRSLEAR